MEMSSNVVEKKIIKDNKGLRNKESKLQKIVMFKRASYL